MDEQIKMSLEQGMWDKDMMHFQDLYASPAKSEASSVDIYDGLDMQTSTVQAVENSSPARHCLDLYEEILTEEGTAKEASFNDLSSEYEKCQRQLKLLITKLKEMQSLNSNLQNENQCLKKNISALIKTARVEITRKEEEINRLSRRSSAPGRIHGLKLNQPPLSINTSKSNNDPSENINTENLPKINTNLQSKAITSSYSKHLYEKKTCIESGQKCTPINPITKQCKENTVCHSQEQTLDLQCLEVSDRKKKEMNSWSKERDSIRSKERHKSSYVSPVSESADLKEKAAQSPQKCGKNESSQKSRSSESEVGCETEHRKHHSSSTKEKTQLKDLDCSKEKQVKKKERSPNRKESRKHEKERHPESRHRTDEKNEEPRRSKRTLNDDGSHNLLEQSDSKKSSDSGRKDKRSLEYRESKYGSKDAKPSKSESSTKNKLDRENKPERSDRDRREEKKRSRDEQDRNKYDQKDKGRQTKDADVHQSSTKNKAMHSKVSKDKSGKKAKVDSTQKDLKLSFMETLNLTLSPAKKTPDDPQPVVSSLECEVERNLTISCSQLRITDITSEPLCPEKSDLRHTELVSADKATEVLNAEDSKQVSQSGPVVEKMCVNKQSPNSEVDDNSELLAKLTVDDKLVVCAVLDTVSSEEVDTHSLVDGSDFIDLDSFIVIDKCSGSPCSQTPNTSVSAEQIEADASILEQSGDADSKTFKLTSNLTETPKDLPPETNTKSTYLSGPEELNKENCQPGNKSDCGLKTLAVASSDEVEEGEILSEDEQMCKQTSNPSQLVPDQMTSVTKSQTSQHSELNVPKPDMLIMASEKSKTKHKAKIHTLPKVSEFPTSTPITPSADSCLDGILKIVTPSCIQDILHMLRIIRKHIRKKYMKLKILFSLNQFLRIIEAATLCFITLVRSLDWSSLCSSPEILQKKLCRHIETSLQKLKKNGIVDRIFQQRPVNMKKSLLNFVEEQLDSLFNTLKAVILKLCDKCETENSAATCTSTPKSDPVTSSEKKRKKHINKCLPSPGSVTCLKQRELHNQARVSNPKTQDNNGVQKGSTVSVDISSSNVSSASKLPHLSPAKTSTSNELCHKSQLNCSGLSFNLVSDDHMGDIFKSLLHDLPSNTLPENMWILGTPEKTVSVSHTFDNVDSLSENKMPTEGIFSWSSISPPHMQTFARIETVLTPDVFDESCLLEIPTSASSSKTLNAYDDRLNSYSSVLMEDLAVSLTLPSPLKSDSHLSFLRPVCDTEPISNVDVKCCEGSALDEEDATEQDIHLTLDSDNSSIGSLEDAGELGSFQYHPSEPMQAVVMEKSNDHFIVKIRRAVSSSSLLCDYSSERTDNAAIESLPNLDGSEVETDVWLYTKSETHNGSILHNPECLDLGNVTENSIVDGKRPESVPLTAQVNESVFKLPPSRSPNLEIKPPADILEYSEINCENITNCIKETCSQGLPAEILPMKTSDSNTVDLDLNLKKKKRKSLDEEPSAKRQKSLSSHKDQGTNHNKIEDLHPEKSKKKKSKRTVHDGPMSFHSSKVSPTSLSAENVVKKRGEVVVSWTRDQDRAILIECQKIGPTKKTFLLLSSTMNKFPYQVEERFRQLMKLFKKSRNSSS